MTWGSLTAASPTSDGGIRKAAGGSWYGAAIGTTELTGDGRLEFRVTHTGANPYVNAATVCLDSGASEPLDRGTLDHCVLVGAGVAAVYERGRWTQETPLATTDTLGIAVQGGVVRYTRNGAVFHTAGLPAAFPARPVWMSGYDGYGLAMAALVGGAPAPGPALASGTGSPIDWTALVSATAPGDGTVRKLASSGWYAAARSSQALAGDGRFEFAASDTGTNPATTAMRFCLDSGGYDPTAPETLEHCLAVGAGYASVYVLGRWSADVAMSVSDRLAIGVEAGAVRYYRNGAPVYTAGAPPALPLHAVWTTNFDGFGLTQGRYVGAASSPSPSPAPPPAPPPPTGAGTATLSWEAPQTRTDGSALVNLAGYRIYYGSAADALTRTVVVSNPSLSSYAIDGLSPATWYFAMSAVDANGVESARTAPVSKRVD